MIRRYSVPDAGERLADGIEPDAMFGSSRDYLEPCTAVRPFCYPDLPSVGVHDALNDRQSESGTITSRISFLDGVIQNYRIKTYKDVLITTGNKGRVTDRQKTVHVLYVRR